MDAGTELIGQAKCGNVLRCRWSLSSSDVFSLRRSVPLGTSFPFMNAGVLVTGNFIFTCCVLYFCVVHCLSSV